MLGPRTIEIPELVRIKPGVLARTAEYLERGGLTRPTLLVSAGLPEAIVTGLRTGFSDSLPIYDIASNELDDVGAHANTVAHHDPDVIVGVGGGRALDAAKFIAAELSCAYVAVPTSVSNDGFASPNASLSSAGRRCSRPARMAYGVLIDTAVCATAPAKLWIAGIGDLVAKLSAVSDWKLAYHARGTAVDDMAALLSDNTVFALLARPSRDAEGLRLLATALLLNGVAMQIAGSSRPASGSEHLISHALDHLGASHHLHGIQVGVATYVTLGLLERTELPRRDGRGRAVKRELVQSHRRRVAELFSTTKLWDLVRAEPFRRSDFLEAVRLAPSMKPDYYTVLDTRDCIAEVAEQIAHDPALSGCFV